MSRELGIERSDTTTSGRAIRFATAIVEIAASSEQGDSRQALVGASHGLVRHAFTELAPQLGHSPGGLL
jgi:hypothetical protein